MNPPAAETFADVIRQRRDDDRPGVLSDDGSVSWAETVHESAVRAALALEVLDPHRPRHVGVLLDNVPEFAFWIGGAALAGLTIVGINSTRREAELARDIEHTDCQLIVTQSRLAPLLGELVDEDRLVVVDDPGYRTRLAGQSPDPVFDLRPSPSDRLLLLFTSGSTGAPKAVVCSQGRLVVVSDLMCAVSGHTASTVAYMAMPLFHGNSLMANYAAMVRCGGTVAMRPAFSVSAFLSDLRRYEATFFNYVGRALAYILSSPEQPDDADNPLEVIYGTEASYEDREHFSRRFGCRWVETYGSSEGPVLITPDASTPPGSLGRPWPGQSVDVADPENGATCPAARFDRDGRLLNADECIGEIVGRGMAHLCEGYYRNPEATAERMRNGDVWTGDLGYRDMEGQFYFAGRAGDRLRVDGENFAAAPVERILMRFPGTVMCAVYPVPDERTGDQVMAAFELGPGGAFDPEAFAMFLTEQPDLSTKWAPRFVCVVPSIPLTPTNKVFKSPLRNAGWVTEDPVWWRPGRALTFVPLGPDARRHLAAELERHGRLNLLPGATT
jgi:fatty-acyl-CoA synthase